MRPGCRAVITRRFNGRLAASRPGAPNGHASPPRRVLRKENAQAQDQERRQKRFGLTGTGKVKRNWGHKRHRLINKSKQGKRLRRGTTTLEKGDAKLVLTYMPYMRG